MTEPVHIRPSTTADAAAVSEIYLRAHQQFIAAYAPLAHSEDDVRQWIAQVLIPAGGVYVADVDGAPVGMLGIVDRGNVRWIDHLYLAPEAVNQGIGTQLLTHARSLLQPPIHLYTFQANSGARRFYERHGFTPIAFGDGSGNEEGCPDVLYAWHPDGHDLAVTTTTPRSTKEHEGEQ